jgi:N-acetylneuraminate synthase
MMRLPTFILDLAGNHNGSIDHGLAIIRAHAEIVQRHGITAAIKFQWRDLERYSHGNAAYAEK